MAAHARLSASGSKRWMSCPGSVAAEARVPGTRKSSIFAMEGTAAHLLCEMYSSQDLHPREFKNFTIEIVGGDAYFKDDEARPDGPAEASFVVDEAMIDAVEYYVAAVEAARARLDPLGREEFSEQWIDMTWLHPLLGGTGDYIGVEAFGWAELVDYKHGRGVTVEVQDNSQLKIYGTGVLHMFPDCEGVRMTIVQPRKEHEDGPIRSIEYTRAELMEFAAELKEAAEETQRANAPFRAGEHCGFCSAKVYVDENGDLQECPTLAAKIEEEAGFSFDDAPPEVGSMAVPTKTRDLARLAEWAPVLDGWIKAVKGTIENELMSGRPVEGFKVVRKKANRAFMKEVTEVDEITGEETSHWAKMSEDETVEALAKELVGPVEEGTEPDLSDIDTSVFYQPSKVKSPAQVEKLGKPYKAAVAKLSRKPEGGLTVVAESDPREAVDLASAAASDFDDEPGDV